MSKDIRSFFTVASKKTNSINKPQLGSESKRSKPIIVDSDEEYIDDTPKQRSKSKKNVISSDSEEDTKKPPNKKSQKSKSPNKKSPTKKLNEKSEKLKPVNIFEIFKDAPIKQSKVEIIPPKEKDKKENETEKKKRKKKRKTELGVHDDEDFEKTLLELDDDILLENVDILDKTVNDALGKQSPNVKQPDSSKENSPNKKEEKAEKRKSKKSDHETPNKKPKLNESALNISGQEAFENRRMMYERYLHRGPPKNHGVKTYPDGDPLCLKGLTFLRTGVLDSLLGEEFEEQVSKHGGRVVHSVSKKVNYVVAGEEAGPSKLAKAESYKIPIVSEDEFLDLILTKSKMEPKYVKEATKKEEDSGIGTSQSEEFVEQSTSCKDPATPKKDEVKTGKKRKKTEDSSPDSPLHVSSKPRIEATPTKAKPIESRTNSTSSSTQVDIEQQKPEVYVCWTEKHKPKDIKQVIGQQRPDSELNRLYKWLQNWNENRKKGATAAKKSDGSANKCALLSGPPGVGKTTMATLVSKALGFDIVEFNASDTRSQKLLREEVSELVKSRTIVGYGQNDSKMKRVLIMDEVDGMAGNEDRGGIQGLIQIIKDSSIPIICMCNDRYHPKIKSLVNYCLDLRVSSPKPEQLKGFLKSICFREGIQVSYEALGSIVKNTGGDLRQALNYLSLWSIDHNEISEKTAKGTDKLIKDTIPGPWDVIRKVFSHKNHPSDPQPMSLADRTRLFFYDYSVGPLFVQENYLHVTPRMEFGKTMKPKHETLLRLAAATDAMSFGALVEGKIRSTNNWSLLESQAMYSSVLPGFYMAGTLSSHVGFPGWLGKNSKRNKLSRMLSEVHTHAKPRTCCSKMAIQMDYVNPFRSKIMSLLSDQSEGGIQDAIDFLKIYKLTKDDYDNLLQIMTWSTVKFPDIPAKVKSAFTRAYKKAVRLEQHPTLKKGKNYDEGDEVAVSSEDDDDVKNNHMIKVTVRKDSGENSSNAKTFKGKGTGKGRKK